MTNKTNALQIYGNTYQIANKELAKNVNVMIKALQENDRATWSYAIALNNIVVNELFKDDFGTIEKFANALGLTKGAMSQYVNAIKYASEHNLIGLNGYSIKKCYLLSTLKENEKAFIDYVKANKIELATISTHALEDLLKTFKTSQNETNENETSNEKETKKDTIIEIVYKKNVYNIPLSVLSKYIVDDRQK